MLLKELKLTSTNGEIKTQVLIEMKCAILSSEIPFVSHQCTSTDRWPCDTGAVRGTSALPDRLARSFRKASPSLSELSPEIPSTQVPKEKRSSIRSSLIFPD